MERLFMAFIWESLNGKSADSLGVGVYQNLVGDLIKSSEGEEDLKAALQELDKAAGNSAQPNPWIKLFSQFLEEQMVPVLDKGESEFFKDAPRLAAAARELILTQTPERLQLELAQIFKLAGKTAVWVRAAAPLSGKLKARLRASFKNDFVIFKQDSNLLGGLQVFAHGKMIDASWSGQLKQILNVG